MPRKPPKCPSAPLSVDHTTSLILLSDNGIGEEGARALGDALKTNTTLTEMVLICEQQDHKQTQQEQGRHNGTWSDWTDNRIGDEGARALGGALKTNTTLTKLNMEGEQQDELTTHSQAQAPPTQGLQAVNGLGDEGKKALREALQANTALTQLGI